MINESDNSPVCFVEERKKKLTIDGNNASNRNRDSRAIKWWKICVC